MLRHTARFRTAALRGVLDEGPSRGGSATPDLTRKLAARARAGRVAPLDLPPPLVAAFVRGVLPRGPLAAAALREVLCRARTSKVAWPEAAPLCTPGKGLPTPARGCWPRDRGCRSCSPDLSDPGRPPGTRGRPRRGIGDRRRLSG